MSLSTQLVAVFTIQRIPRVGTLRSPSGAQQHACKTCDVCMFCFVCSPSRLNQWRCSPPWGGVGCELTTAGPVHVAGAGMGVWCGRGITQAVDSSEVIVVSRLTVTSSHAWLPPSEFSCGEGWLWTPRSSSHHAGASLAVHQSMRVCCVLHRCYCTLIKEVL